VALKLLTGPHIYGRQAQRCLNRNNDVVCDMMGKRVHVPFVALACLLTLTPVLAHDNWISRGGFRGPKNGEWCCGANDCFVVSAQSVRVNGAGYELAQTKETVPYEETIPSIDGQYWRCQRPDGSRRCFFAPMVGF
jgi:hypothetical protein